MLLFKYQRSVFYAFYSLKEDFLFQILDEYEERFAEQMKQTLLEKGDKKQKIMKVLRQYYLSEGSIGFYLSPDDREFITRRMESYDWQDAIEKSKAIYESIFQLCNKEMNLINLEIASQLIRAIKYTVLSEEPFSEESGEKTIDIFVNNFADFLVGNYDKG